MLLWFAGASVVIVWAVFKSPAIDYRLVMLGAVLPVGEVVFDSPRLLHTLVLAAAVLFAIVLFTQRERLFRRRLIGIPIVMMLHLALDGTWTRAEVFWWPFLGRSFGTAPLPELERPWLVILVLDLVGVGCLVWAYRRFGLDDPDRRRRFISTGQLDRAVSTGAGG
jgi:membrane-bound metal-dependent hydrolase YbcI (DUF457 family)